MLKNLTLMAAFGLLASPALADIRQVDLSVPGMYCASCPFIVQSAIGSVDGVSAVTADVETRTATVVFDDEIAQLELILAATENAGYAATLLPEGS